MTTRIETPRLIMREFTLEDVEAVFEFGTHAEVSRYTGDAGDMTTLADAEQVIRAVWLAEYQQYGYARYALVHKADNRVIGFCGLKYMPQFNAPDIGYRMLPEYWGQGLGLEAVAATLTYAKNQLGINHIVGEVVTENHASSKILMRLGFKHTEQYEKLGVTFNRYDYFG
ncbi:GNAT family N-acetyltransferase [Corallincola spongiicola]|uniref:N-acetyltransferase n=1 Tax=Corallincola spongiicola TaxID=2520508 RepID=A0ABY1WS26_9GAMM|nr:GNAT family N-acetyltransferase [Corallincola spongiicola]TAA47530.1 N-acetyltransferase [Corallincola spongiicola]